MSWDFTADLADLWEWDADDACLVAPGAESVDLESIDPALGWDDPAEMPEEFAFVDDVDVQEDVQEEDELAPVVALSRRSGLVRGVAA